MRFNDMIKVVLSDMQESVPARIIAEKMIQRFPQYAANKRNNVRYRNDYHDRELLKQITAEITRSSPTLNKEGVTVDRNSKPIRFFFHSSEPIPVKMPEREVIVEQNHEQKEALSESELYPILGKFLKEKLNIYSRRIDEKKSKNNRGPRGNIWLHPDVVGLELIDERFNPKVKQCLKSSGGNRVKLYSFEVKTQISQGNLREYFFQTVSNSSWANQGFLVAEEIRDFESLFSELKMLTTLHGIGFILLNRHNPSESQIIFQAREKSDPDWVSINRLLSENSDFEEYITSLKIYFDSGEINRREWY